MAITKCPMRVQTPLDSKNQPSVWGDAQLAGSRMSRMKMPLHRAQTWPHPLWNEAARCLAAGNTVSHELKKKTSAFIHQCDRQCRSFQNKMDIIIIILSNPSFLSTEVLKLRLAVCFHFFLQLEEQVLWGEESTHCKCSQSPHQQQMLDVSGNIMGCWQLKWIIL